MANSIPVRHDLNLLGNNIIDGHVNTPTAETHIANKSYADALVVYNTLNSTNFVNSFTSFGGIKVGDLVHNRQIVDLLDDMFFPTIPVTWSEANASFSVLNNLKIGEETQNFDVQITMNMNDRPVPIVNAEIAVSIFGGGENVIPVTLTPNGTISENISVPLVYESLSVELRVTVDPMSDKADNKGNISSPPPPYDTQTQLLFNVPVEALYPYIIHAYDLGTEPDYNLVTYNDLRSLSDIVDNNFCSDDNAEYDYQFLTNEGPFSFLVAIADSTSLNVLMDSIDDISVTFTKIPRTFNMHANVSKQYDLYVHQTGVVPWAQNKLYTLKRLN